MNANYGRGGYGGPPPQAPPEPEPPHVCASGSLWCSGISMCDPCFNLLREAVISKMIVASGMNGASFTMLYDLVAALRQRGIDPATHLGVHVDLSRFDPTEQVRSAFASFEEGLRLLHEKIDTDPELQRRIVFTPVSAQRPFDERSDGYGVPNRSWQGAPEIRSPAMPEPPPEIYAPPPEASPAAPVVAHPTTSAHDPFGFGWPVPPSKKAPPEDSPTTVPVVMGSIFGAPTSGAVQDAPEPPRRPQVTAAPIERLTPRVPNEIERARSATRVLDAEEIALAGGPVDPPPDRSANGAG